MRHSLRLYTGDAEESEALAAPGITITLGEISEILADAVGTRRAWVRDLEDEKVAVSSDLYEVLSTYWNMRRGA